MADDAVHELTAAYALDALDASEVRAYEEHLAHCQSCQRELAAFSAVAGALAFAAEPADPPPGLRDRILETARAERPNVIPLRPRTRGYAIGALAAAACAVAVGLGIWNVVLHNRLDRSHVAAVVVDRGTLVVTGLEPAPAGKTYEAWVIDRGAARPAGLFHGGDSVILHLASAVPRGAVVGVTLERAGGTKQPTSQPLVTSAPV